MTFIVYLSFIAVALIVIATPGPSVMFVIARSINLGAKGGLYSVVGVSFGALVHAIAVALGLAAVLSTSPTAFLVIRNLGCLYLVYLGVATMCRRPNSLEGSAQPQMSTRKILLQGFLVEFLNPKTALFFLAFLPQFTSKSSGHLSTQLLLLGITFVVIGLISDSIYAITAGRISHWLKRSQRFQRSERYISGSLYTLLGLGGLLFDQHPGVELSARGQ